MPVYIGVFLTPTSRARLIEAVPIIHGKVFAEHVTLAFGKEMRDLTEYPIGAEIPLLVTGFAEDERGQAVVIDDTPIKKFMGERRAHITLSCAEGVKPFYSNELIAKGVTPLKEPITLLGVVDSFPRSP